MKSILTYFVLISILTSGCRSKDIFEHKTSFGNEQIQMVSKHYASKKRKPRIKRKHKDGDITVSYPFGYYLKTLFHSQSAIVFSLDTNYQRAYSLIIYSKNGELSNFSSSPGKVGDTHFGKFEMNFKRGRINHLYFKDSIGRASGPVLFFKRNGKIKHVIVADTAGYCKQVYYTRKSRQLSEDTSFLSTLRLLAKRNQILYDSIYSKP